MQARRNGHNFLRLALEFREMIRVYALTSDRNVLHIYTRTVREFSQVRYDLKLSDHKSNQYFREAQQDPSGNQQFTATGVLKLLEG